MLLRRLFSNVREKHGLCYSVYASYESHRDRGTIIGYAQPATADARPQMDLQVHFAFDSAELTPQAWLESMSELIRSRASESNDNFTAVCVSMIEEPDADETTVIIPSKRRLEGEPD